MGIPDRVFNLAKVQLDKVMTRWEEIDIKAQQEMDEFMARYQDNNGVSAWDRAMGKINQAQAAKELNNTSPMAESLPEPSLDELERKIAIDRANAPAGSSPAPQNAPQPSTQTLIGAYKILGVEPGADMLSVQKAYQTLRERAAPERFPAGSPEAQTAQGHSAPNRDGIYHAEQCARFSDGSV